VIIAALYRLGIAKSILTELEEAGGKLGV